MSVYTEGTLSSSFPKVVIVTALLMFLGQGPWALLMHDGTSVKYIISLYICTCKRNSTHNTIYERDI